ncbi:MAG: hypothetical protein NC399_02570 [Muribaculum sp.]|nr:hypothetical protein [Muribaculum sp.]
MKKYVIAYSVLFLILLGLGLTHGIPFGITIWEKNWSMATYPETIREIVLIYNIIIMWLCFVIAVILTKQKQNVLKCKWLIPVIMFICLAFLPMGMYECVIYVPWKYKKEFWSFISLLTHQHDIGIYH